jgi:hypothetical protein
MNMVLILFNDALIAALAIREYLYLFLEFKGVASYCENDDHDWCKVIMND